MLRLSISLLAVLLPALLTGCESGTTTSGSTSESGSAGLSLQLQYNGAALTCDSTLNIAGKPWSLQQFQLYLSEFSVNNTPLLLDPTLPYQQANIALLGAVCDGNALNSRGNWQLKFASALPSGSLSFTVGVPQLRNHQDPLLAKTPLNQSDMFWSWQQGYKYLRLELAGKASDKVNSPQANAWALHLGATGCQSASVLRAPSKACAQPNLARINLPFQRGQTLQLDLAPLLHGINMSADNHCMSDINRLSCQTLLPRLGINGKALGWSMQ